MRKPNVTIIVPVYGDWDSLEQNIRSLLETVPETSGHKVLFANDCGPEADYIEKNLLKLINGHKHFSYHRNDHNLGFVKNCNNAVLNLSDQDTDVLLLNSDTKVTKGFLKSMQKVLYAKKDIGAVCPRSNAATIFSVPMNTKSHTNYTMEQSYRLYKKIKWRLPKYYISPIAHGFCMMIKRSVIKQYGLFDEIYGKGYGEENDFCMRIRREGWKCAVANRAFVFHYKARSFSDERRAKLVENNEKVLMQRYPEYRTLVREYVEKTVRPFERRIAVNN